MSGIARFCNLIYTFFFEKAIGLSNFCHVCVTAHTRKTKKLPFSIKNATSGSFRMSLIIVFFYKKGEFGRKFIVQHGIYYPPFVTVLSFNPSKRNAAAAKATALC